MRRMAVTFIIASVSGVIGFGQNGAAPSLDVVGIRIGMTVKEAAVALKADNPRLMLMPSTGTLEGFSQALLLSMAGREAPSGGPNGEIVRAAENIEVLFTTPPGPEVVWGVQRTYTFATKDRPDLQITLDALRKKYGPESVPPSPDPRDQSKFIVWVYDAQGKPMGPAGAQLNMMCGGLVTRHFGNGENITMTEIQSGQPVPAPCQSLTIVNASVQASRLDPANPQFVVNSLIVQIGDNSKHQGAVEGTRAVALAAAKAREGKQAEEVKRRGAPKL